MSTILRTFDPSDSAFAQAMDYAQTVARVRALRDALGAAEGERDAALDAPCPRDGMLALHTHYVAQEAAEAKVAYLMGALFAAEREAAKYPSDAVKTAERRGWV